MSWEEMGWDEKSWDEVRRARMIWDEMKCGVWSASVKCEVRGVKSTVWSGSVKKVFAWRCIAPGSRAGHVLGQQHCNSFAQSTHARAWLAHGACKYYRWERSYSISLRQLPPRLMRVLLVDKSTENSTSVPKSALNFTKSQSKQLSSHTWCSTEETAPCTAAARRSEKAWGCRGASNDSETGTKLLELFQETSSTTYVKHITWLECCVFRKIDI